MPEPSRGIMRTLPKVLQMVALCAWALCLACGGGGTSRGGSSSTSWNTYSLGDSAAGTGTSAYKVWKSGVEVCTLPSGANPATMAVAGTDVYVAGFQQTTPTTWKNGIVTTGLVPTPNIYIMALASVEN